MTTVTTTGWLTSLARGTRPERTPAVAIPPGAFRKEAWTIAARACGGDEEKLARRIAAHLGLPRADIEHFEPKVLGLVPEKVARRYGVLPLRELLLHRPPVSGSASDRREDR